MLQDTRLHVNAKKTNLAHSCLDHDVTSERKRTRALPTSIVLAVGSPIRGVLKNLKDPVAVGNTLQSLGSVSASTESLRRFFNKASVTSWEQFVAEMVHLDSFLAEMQELDPEGLYFVEYGDDTYDDHEVHVFQRYFASFGAARKFVQDTSILYFVVSDGAHLKSAFGGVVLAAVVTSANNRIFPIAWAVCAVEDEQNCVWFASEILNRFPGIDFVWMTDQGSGFTGAEFQKLLLDRNQLHSFCAKHVVRTLEVMKSAGQITGSLKGVRQLVFSFARARSFEWSRKILAEIKAVNKDVAKYLKERESKLAAAAFLTSDRVRGGRITSQLVESFFNMILDFRKLGFVEGIIWMCEKFHSIQLSQREKIRLWDAAPNGFAFLSKSASKKFQDELAGAEIAEFDCVLQSVSHLELRGDVTKKSDGSVRQIVVGRESTEAKLHVDCDCLKRQEFGFPCKRVVVLMIAGGWVRRDESSNLIFPIGVFSSRLLRATWVQQASLEIPIPRRPAWLEMFSKQNPRSGLRKALKVPVKIMLLPPRILAQAGRPKENVRKKRKTTTHFRRFKAVTERGTRGKTNEIGSEESGDDLDVVVENDVSDGQPSSSSSDMSDESALEEDEKDELDNKIGSFAELFVRAGKKSKPDQSGEKSCASCGNFGHTWPTCRKKDVELMLRNMKFWDCVDSTLLVEQRKDDQIDRIEQNLEPFIDDEEVIVGKIRKIDSVDECCNCKKKFAHNDWRAFATKTGCGKYCCFDQECSEKGCC